MRSRWERWEQRAGPLGTGLCLVQSSRNTVPVPGEAPGAAFLAWRGSRLGWVCSGEGLLVLPHQQLLLIRHHLKLIRRSFAGSCVLRAKEALQSERFCVPLRHGRMALLVCRRGLLGGYQLRETLLLLILHDQGGLEKPKRAREDMLLSRRALRV